MLYRARFEHIEVMAESALKTGGFLNIEDSPTSTPLEENNQKAKLVRLLNARDLSITSMRDRLSKLQSSSSPSHLTNRDYQNIPSLETLERLLKARTLEMESLQQRIKEMLALQQPQQQ
jgi:hypothetical protein